MTKRYQTGKLPKKSDYRTLLFKRYALATLPPPPSSYDVAARVYSTLKVSDPTVLWPMDGNDTYGDCTFAAKAHALTTYNGLVGSSSIMAGADVVSDYLAFTGGQDTGCAELDVLNDWRQNAFGGDKILAYAAITPSNHVHVQQAIQLFGGVYLGFQVQENAITDFDNHIPWTPGTLTDDGHAVYAVAYDSDGVTVLTWGNVQKATWDWWNECVDEAYAIVPPEASSPAFCPGFDSAQLIADLAVVTA